jgi:hypothetical protein
MNTQKTACSADRLEPLRREVKKLLIDRGLDKHGSGKEVLAIARARLGREINENTYYMAMSGNRNGKVAEEILTAIRTAMCLEKAAA